MAPGSPGTKGLAYGILSPLAKRVTVAALDYAGAIVDERPVMPLHPNQAVLSVSALRVEQLPGAIEGALADLPECRIVSVSVAPAAEGLISGAVVVVEFS